MRIRNMSDTPTQSQLIELRELVADLYWEYDRMSSSGKETVDRIDQIVLPNFDD
tara:strand:+ start:889 stop:1050 length:162 start_codon:yes stop_codon:yes gene_type:complete